MLLARYARAEDDNQRAAINIQIRRALRQYAHVVLQNLGHLQKDPTLFERVIRDITRGSLISRGADTSKQVLPRWLISKGVSLDSLDADTSTQVDSFLHPAPVMRYPDIQTPRRITVGRRVSIIVRLRIEQHPDSAVQAAFQAEAGRPVEARLLGSGVEVLDDDRQMIELLPDRDSPPAVFDIVGHEPGTAEVRLEFWQDRLPLLRTDWEIAVAAEEVPDDQAPVVAPGLNTNDYRPPFPDLLLRVSQITRDGVPKLHFEAWFPGGDALPVGEKELLTDPQQYWLRQVNDLEKLVDRRSPTGASPDPKRLTKEIRKIGQNIWNNLLPDTLKREYLRVREQIDTLLIVTDEPWIPWELVLPYDADWRGEFLCMQHAMSRWMLPHDGHRMAAQIEIPGLACLAPHYNTGGTLQYLPFAAKERELLQSLAQTCNIADRSPESATYDSVEALLEGSEPIGLWHFAGHGDLNKEDPDRSPFHLENREILRPYDIVGNEMEGRLREDRPLVFMNACRVGTGAMAIGGVGGWAAHLVGRCGCGAFLAPLWSVNDDLALEIARHLYDGLRAGLPLAQALLQARRKVREQAPEDPTWLAYSLYGHPNAVVHLLDDSI